MITAGEGTLFHEKRLMVFSLQSKVSNLADHTRVSGPIRQLKSYSFSKKRSKSIKLKMLMFVKELTALFETQSVLDLPIVEKFDSCMDLCKMGSFFGLILPASKIISLSLYKYKMG